MPDDQYRRDETPEALPHGEQADALHARPSTGQTNAAADDLGGDGKGGDDEFDAAASRPVGAATHRSAAEPEPSLFRPPSLEEQERMVEAILFASAEPVTLAELSQRLPHGSDPSEALRLLERRYQGRGVTLRRVGDSWAFRTAPDLGFLMRREVVETRKLSRAAIETLAIIAYHQPVTRSEIEEIRGVAVSRGTIDQLLELDWVRFGRRKMTPGRPVTFVVTEDFLDHFGLVNARDLPGLKELRASGLLDSRGLAGADVSHPLSEPDPDEADQPDPAQGDMFGA